MKHLVLALILGVGFGMVGTAPVQASGVIESACLRSDRPTANRALCNCLQQVADAVLTPSYQKRGAVFFADPHKSQEMRASGHAADELFWAHWVRFSDTAVKHCQ